MSHKAEASLTQRLDAYLASIHPGHSRGVWAKHVKSGHIHINGQPIEKTSHSVNVKKDIVTVHIPEASNKVPIEVTIVHEDDALLVINKPIGLLTHAKGGIDDEFTVEDFAASYVEPGTERGGIVHRLDRDTSGLLMIAKNQKSYEHLQEQFATRAVKKTYIALVDGVVLHHSALFDWPIERNPNKPHLFRVGPNGKESQTKLTVLETFKKHTLVELLPKTGRTHQLRVHMQQYEHPIVGDVFYNDRASKAARLYLHAKSLSFKLPGGADASFVCEPEWDIASVVEK